jgi:hypothetical protein
VMNLQAGGMGMLGPAQSCHRRRPLHHLSMLRGPGAGDTAPCIQHAFRRDGPHSTFKI